MMEGKGKLGKYGTGSYPDRDGDCVHGTGSQLCV